MGTHLNVDYTRNATDDGSGNEIFEIVSECTDEGDKTLGTGLNDRGIFLYSIFNTRDATADIFQRVCTLNDLEAYEDDRDTAVGNSQEYWRSHELVRTFTELTTAVSAVRVLDDRINALVNDYGTYINQFKAYPTPDPVTYPTVTPTYETELKAIYETEVEDFETALLASTAAGVARDTTITTLSAANDTLKEWQETQDLVVGGNLSGEGNRYGLKTYVTEIANAFKNLYDGSGASPYATSVEGAGGVKDAMDTYISSVETVEVGSITTRKLSVAPGAAPLPTDIGIAVTSDAGGTGTLVSFEIRPGGDDYWWIGNAVGDWGVAGVVVATVAGGSFATGLINANAASDHGPLDGLATLVTSRDNLGTTINTIIANGLPTKMVEATTHAIDGANAVGTHVTDITTAQAAAVTTAETDLNTKEAAYIVAQATTQTAYDDVITAYADVKAVCPAWSPDPPLPAQP